MRWTVITLCLVLAVFFGPLSANGFENVKFLKEIPTGSKAPADVAVSNSGDIYVVDAKESRVLLFSGEGTLKGAFGSSGKKLGQLKKPRGVAVGTSDGHVFVADSGNSRISVFDAEGTPLSNFGRSGSKPGQFSKPMGIAVDQFGYVYVADSGNKRVQIFTSMGIFMRALPMPEKPLDVALDPARNLYVLVPKAGAIFKFGPDGSQKTKIKVMANGDNYVPKATGLGVDARGDVYISEDADQSVKKVNEKGMLLISFGSEGEGRGQFDDPGGLACDARGRVYVADTKNKRIQIFEISGSTQKALDSQTTSPPVVLFDDLLMADKGVTDLSATKGHGVVALNAKKAKITLLGDSPHSFGKSGSKPGMFRKPQALHLTPDGKLFVADTGNNRVQILTPRGAHEYHFGKSGHKTGQFKSPSGIAVNSKGILYVADTKNHRIEIFNPDTMFLAAFGIETKDAKNPAKGSMKQPGALAIDSDDNVFVLDFRNNRVQRFDSDGRIQAVIGGPGDTVGRFDNPTDIAIDEENYLYVADGGNSRVQVFDAKGKFIIAFGSPGEGPGRFKQLQAVAATGGKVYVADAKTPTLQVFDFHPKGVIREDRKYATQMAYPAPGISDPAQALKLTRKAAVQKAVATLAKEYGVSPGHLQKFIEVEKEETLSDGRMRVTISAPKKIPAEPKKDAGPKVKAMEKKPVFDLQ